MILIYSSASAGGPIEDLVGFDILNALYPRSLLEWRKTNPVVMPQSCGRQLWFFSRQTMGKFPMHDVEKYQLPLMHGRDVYHHLLKVIVGADSPYLGETNIAGQFNEGWAKFVNDHPAHIDKFDRIIQNLWMDSNLIRTHFVSAFQSKRHETAVRYLNEPKGGETVLLIGEVNGDGSLAHTTNYVARAFGNGKKAAGEIIVTNPDPEQAALVFEGMMKLKERNMLACKVAFMPFEDLAIGFEVADTCLIAIPQAKDSEVDATIISTWKNRQRDSNKLTHLRGDPFENMGGSNPEWIEAELNNFIPVEDVRKRVVEIEQRNAYLLMVTAEAISYCTECRVNNQRPDKRLMAQLSSLTSEERDALFVKSAFAGKMDLTP